METRKKTWKRKEIVTLPPSYIQAPGLICITSLVVIHKGVEVVVVGISSFISVMSFWLGKQVDWAVIDHMSWGVASSTDPKVANVIRMSPSETEITLGRQTMMCCMTMHCLSTGRAGVHGAEEAMMTEIRANVAMGVGRGGS